MLCESVAGVLGSGSKAGTARWPGMMESTPAAMAARKGTSSVPFNSSRSPGTVARARWESTATLPCPGKMFGGGDGAVFLHAANELRDVFGDGLRIFAERTHVDDGIVGIVIHVGIGREDPVHAGGARFEGNGLADNVGELGIASGGDGHGGREGSAFVEAHAGARFKVGAKKQRNFRAALKLVGDDGGGVDLAFLDAERARARSRRSCRRCGCPRPGGATPCILRSRWK